MQRKWELDDGLDGREEFPLPDGIGKSLRGSAEEAPTTSWIGDAAVSAQPPGRQAGCCVPAIMVERDAQMRSAPRNQENKVNAKAFNKQSPAN
jgi:hypothetical protein